MNQQELENLVKRASDKMRADDNAKGTAKYLEHFSWLLFLKVFEQVEDQAELIAEIDGKSHQRVIDGDYRWSAWTQRDLTGDDLTEFITDELLPHLRALSGSPQADKVRQLFESVTTVMKSGYVLAEVIEIVDQVEFDSADDYHAISVIYERLLSEMGSDASWSGEFYTPRSIVELMVRVSEPKLGESIYDPCSGSCGFLVTAYELLIPKAQEQAQRRGLQDGTFHGKEAGELPFLLGSMNMMLHGIEVPDNVRGNTLEQDVRALGPGDQHDLVVTNPPFGGKENPQVQQNFPIRSTATEVLFLQHIIASLKPDGRAAVVVPDGILFDDDTAFRQLRRKFLSDTRLHTVVRLPVGSFPNTPHQRLNLLFFEKAGPTEGIWFYEHLVPENRRHITPARYTKRNPLRRDEFEPIYGWWTKREPNESAWFVEVDDIDDQTFDLDFSHPDRPPRVEVIATELVKEELADAQAVLARLRDDLADFGIQDSNGVEPKTLDDLGIELNPENFDPRTDPDEPFTYIDLSAVDRGVIAPGEPVKGKDAPSRARRVVKEDDILFATVRPNLRGHAVIPSDLDGAIASTGFAVLRPPEDIDPSYLFLALMSPEVTEQCMATMRGAHYPALRVDHVKGLRIRVPSKPEQKAIVEQILPRVAHVRAVRQSLTELFETLKDSEYSLIAQDALG